MINSGPCRRRRRRRDGRGEKSRCKVGTHVHCATPNVRAAVAPARRPRLPMGRDEAGPGATAGAQEEEDSTVVADWRLQPAKGNV